MPFTVTKTVNNWASLMDRLEREDQESLYDVMDTIDRAINYRSVHEQVTIEFNDTERSLMDDYFGIGWRN